MPCWKGDGKRSQFSRGIERNEAGSEPHFFVLTKKARRAIHFVNDALIKHGNLGVYGDLSGGIEALQSELKIVIKENSKEGLYEASMIPYSMQGHDFSFVVSRATGKIEGVVVGEIAPPPDLEMEE